MTVQFFARSLFRPTKDRTVLLLRFSSLAMTTGRCPLLYACSIFALVACDKRFCLGAVLSIWYGMTVPFTMWASSRCPGCTTTFCIMLRQMRYSISLLVSWSETAATAALVHTENGPGPRRTPLLLQSVRDLSLHNTWVARHGWGPFSLFGNRRRTVFAGVRHHNISHSEECSRWLLFAKYQVRLGWVYLYHSIF